MATASLKTTETFLLRRDRLSSLHLFGNMGTHLDVKEEKEVKFFPFSTSGFCFLFFLFISPQRKRLGLWVLISSIVTSDGRFYYGGVYETNSLNVQIQREISSLLLQLSQFYLIFLVCDRTGACLCYGGPAFHFIIGGEL